MVLLAGSGDLAAREIPSMSPARRSTAAKRTVTRPGRRPSRAAAPVEIGGVRTRCEELSADLAFIRFVIPPPEAPGAKGAEKNRVSRRET
jgi:hypothetical protein